MGDKSDYLTLTEAEAAFLKAAVDTIIPADELSPSGSECGVVDFIDCELAGPYGEGARLYRDGPVAKGKPEHGYQLALTPRNSSPPASPPPMPGPRRGSARVSRRLTRRSARPCSAKSIRARRNS